MPKHLLPVILLAGLALVGSNAHAAVINWDNGAGTLNWGDANNWNPNGVPAANNQIQFNGVGVGSAQVPAAAIVNMTGVSVYGANPASTELDLKNGAGFTIDIGSSNNFTYWPTIKVQDAFAYTLTSGALGRLAIVGTTYVDVVAGGSLTVDGAFTVTGYGTADVIKTGAGTMFLTNASPKPNASTVLMNVQGGTLSTASLANLGTGYLAAQLGGTFQYTGAGSNSKTGLLYWNNGSATFDITSATGDAIFNITGGDWSSGGGTFTKTGLGTLTLATSNVNVLLGKPVALNQGTLALQANGANVVQITSTMTGAAGTQIKVLAGTGTVRNDSLTANWSANLASLDVASGGKFALRGNDVRIDALTGGGDVFNGYSPAGMKTLTVGANHGSGNFTGVIHGNNSSAVDNNLENGVLALSKIGSGTQTLSGANTYSGGTTISAGTLNIANTTGSATGSGNVTVNANGTLSGTGSIVGGTVNLFGTVSPGNSVGTLSADNFNWQGGGTYDWEISNFNSTPGVGWDLLDLTGGVLSFVGTGPFNVDIDAAAVGNVLPGNYLFEIARANSIANFSVSNFTLTNNGPNETTWSITQSGNSVYLRAQVAPEPSTFVIFAIGALLCVLGGRRVIVPRT